MATLAAGAFKPLSQAFSKLQFVSGGVGGVAACTDRLSQSRGRAASLGRVGSPADGTVPAELCHGSRLCWRTESPGLSEVSAHVRFESPSMHCFSALELGLQE